MSVMTDIQATGFGYAHIKKEGYAFRYKDSLSWPYYMFELVVYLRRYNKWYLKPVRRIFRRIAEEAWDAALETNAEKISEGGVNEVHNA